jgi:hypothetical protein
MRARKRLRAQRSGILQRGSEEIRRKNKWKKGCYRKPKARNRKMKDCLSEHEVKGQGERKS